MPASLTNSLATRARENSRALGIDQTAIPLIIGFVLLLAVGSVIVWLVTTSQKQAQIVFDAVEIQRDTSRVYRSVLAAESGQRGYLLTSNETYLEPFRSGTKAYPEAMETLRQATRGDQEQSGDVLTVQSLADRKVAELTRTVDLKLSGRGDDALALVNTDVGRDLMAEIRLAVDRIQVRANRAIDVEYEAGLSLNRKLLLATLAALLGILVLAGFVMSLSRKAIAQLQTNNERIGSMNETLEAAVAERTSELTESNEEIQRFAYIVSHDLRAPLVNVMGFTSELEQLKDDLIAGGAKPAGDPGRVRTETEFTESISFIKAAIDKMEGLIAAILRLSREGRRTFQPERIETTSFVEGLVKAQQHQIDEAGVTILVDKDLPALVADRVALEQVFGNLLDNAVKYLDQKRPGRIQISGETIGERARISVADNGRGIAERDHKRVFELFRRSGEQDRRGDGIGLAHVQTLVRSLGGRITLASELGKGTTFTVILPLTQKVPGNLAAKA